MADTAPMGWDSAESVWVPGHREASGSGVALIVSAFGSEALVL